MSFSVHPTNSKEGLLDQISKLKKSAETQAKQLLCLSNGAEKAVEKLEQDPANKRLITAACRQLEQAESMYKKLSLQEPLLRLKMDRLIAKYLEKGGSLENLAKMHSPDPEEQARCIETIKAKFLKMASV
jgi:hypothetical protein